MRFMGFVNGIGELAKKRVILTSTVDFVDIISF